MVLRTFLLLIVLGACSKDNSPVDRSAALIGSWDWQYTEDWDPEFVYQQYTNPELSGQTEVLEFKENGLFVEKKDGKATIQGEFYLFGDDSIRFYNRKYSLDYRFQIKSGQLTLENVADSGLFKTYIKSTSR